MIEKLRRIALDLDEVSTRLNEIGKRQQILVDGFNLFVSSVIPTREDSDAESSKESV